MDGKRVSITVDLKMLVNGARHCLLAEGSQHARHVRGHVPRADDVAHVLRSPENHKVAVSVDHAVVRPVPESFFAQLPAAGNRLDPLPFQRLDYLPLTQRALYIPSDTRDLQNRCVRDIQCFRIRSYRLPSTYVQKTYQNSYEWKIE